MPKAKDYETTMQRILTILNRLYLGEALSVKELAEEFGTSDRTIQRYFNSYLIPAGFPLTKKGRRWVLEKEVELGVDKEAQTAFETIESMAKESGIYEKMHPYLERLKLSTKNNPFFTKLNIENIDEGLKLFTTLEHAIKENKELVIHYHSQGSTKKLTIQPLKIVNFEGYWYLMAITIYDETLKKFHIKSIENIEQTNSSFTPDKTLLEKLENAVNIWYDPYEESIEVRLLADKTAARYLKRLPISKTQTIEGKDSDGSVEYIINVTHLMEIKNIIKWWMPHIIVLEPQELVDEILEEIKTFLRFYNQTQ